MALGLFGGTVCYVASQALLEHKGIFLCLFPFLKVMFWLAQQLQVVSSRVRHDTISTPFQKSSTRTDKPKAFTSDFPLVIFHY